MRTVHKCSAELKESFLHASCLAGICGTLAGPTVSMTMRPGWGTGTCLSRGRATESGHLRDKAA